MVWSLQFLKPEATLLKIFSNADILWEKCLVTTSRTSSRIVSFTTKAPNSPLEIITQNHEWILSVKDVLLCFLMKLWINLGLPSIYGIILFLTSKGMLNVITPDITSLLFAMLSPSEHTCSWWLVLLGHFKRSYSQKKNGGVLKAVLVSAQCNPIQWVWSCWAHEILRRVPGSLRSPRKLTCFWVCMIIKPSWQLHPFQYH